MVSNRHKTAKAAVPGRGRNQRSRVNSRSSIYSHISIQPAASTDPETEEDATTPDQFIRKDSLQLQIEEQLLYQSKLSVSASHLRTTPPRTFAEAAMSTRRGRRDSLRDENGDVSLSGPTSLESLGPFKYTFKKKKKVHKWTPMSLATPDSGSEGEVEGSIYDGEAAGDIEGASSRAGSPSIRPSTAAATSTFVPHPLQQSTIQPDSFDNSESLTTPRKTAARFIEDQGEVDDTDPTPTQERFDLAVRDLLEDTDALDTYASDLSDTQSTKDRTEAAMSQITRALGVNGGEDAFDSLDWDPDLPYSAPDQSPEPIVAIPKPVTYTTVGSRVDPDAVQQISAPNRIQREGAGRRPLMSMMQARSHYDYFQPRGPAPPLSMQNSMQYTQQLASNPQSYNNYSYNSGTSSYSDRSAHAAQVGQSYRVDQNHQESNPSDPRGNGAMGRPSQTTDTAYFSNLRGTGSAAPQIYSGNVRPSPAVPTSSSTGFVTSQFSTNTDSRLNLRPAGQFPNNMEPTNPGLRPSQLREEELTRPNNTNVPVQGLEKMQTLQRLAKFENPMQNLARSRLSEYSAAKIVHHQPPQPPQPPPTEPASALELLLKNRATSNAEDLLARRGELNRGYQFPPPGFTSTTNAQSNPLYQACGPSTQTSTDYAQSRSQGYPQPLTAGPPGQRQYQGLNKAPALSQVEQLWTSDGRTTAVNSTTNTSAQSSSPIDESDRMTESLHLAQQYGLGGSGQAEITARQRPLDTLSMDVIARYYPYGFPSDMNGQYNALTYLNQRAIGLIPDDPIPHDEAGKRAKLQTDLGDWFYSGQRRWGMSGTDHIIEREEAQQRQAQNPFGPIGPPSKLKKMDLTCTPAEFNNKSPTDLAAPLLGAAFGSLLSYADSNTGSRKHLSNMTASSPFLLDSTETGNQSFFGEDWGAPPKKVTRWERYHGASQSAR